MKKTLNIILMILIMFSFVGCAQKKESNDNKYIRGIIENGKTIDDYYELEGETICHGVCIPNSLKIVAVFESATKDGGRVVWKDNIYYFSNELSSPQLVTDIAFKE